MKKEALLPKEEKFKFKSIPEYTGGSFSGDSLFVYEKIDGSNCSLRKDNNILVPYSRARDLRHVNLSRFYFHDFFNWVYSIPELQELPEETILCGEWTHYGFGHINYNPEYMNRFFVLAAFDKRKSEYMHPREVNRLIKEMGIDKEVVRLPVLARDKVDTEILEDIIEMKSDFYSGPREGIVIHEYDPRFDQGLEMYKYFHPDFREIDESKRGILKYVTMRRLIKTTQNLIINGKKIDFDRVVGEAINDILKDSKGVSKKELFKAFNQSEVKSGYESEVLSLFMN